MLLLKKIIGFFLILLFISSVSFAFDHSHREFDQLLKRYVIFQQAQSTVNYQALLKNRAPLDRYLESLSAVSEDEFESFQRDERLAFLINAYNAFTLKLILDHYPVESIKDIGSFFSSPWKKKFFTLFGKKSWLDQIEHEWIRPVFKEPRIHFAVNCASMGCPSLANEAFVAGKLNDQLDFVTRQFLKNRNRNYPDLKKERLYLSKIFKWYKKDFNGVSTFVSQYLNLPEPKGLEVRYLDYDWKLNELKEKK